MKFYLKNLLHKWTATNEAYEIDFLGPLWLQIRIFTTSQDWCPISRLFSAWNFVHSNIHVLWSIKTWQST